MGYLANTQIPWLPAHTDVIVSQKFKLSVVLRTADSGVDSEVDSAHTTMPSPSAKLKASRRLPKHLRMSGIPPSGALAQARAEAEARHARGESNQHGQHSCLQGKRRTVDEAADQRPWNANCRHDDWDSQGRQDGWYTSTAAGSTAVWQARPPPPAPPAPRWRPRIEAKGDFSSKPEEIGPSATSIGPRIPMEAGMDYEPDQEDSHMVELEVVVELPTPKQHPPESANTTQVQERGAGHVVTGPKAAGPRLSAPDSSSEELVAIESDMEAEEVKDARCPATYSDSEELITAASGEQGSSIHQKRRHPAGGHSSTGSTRQSSRGRTTSRTETDTSGQQRPWSRADTDLSKTLSHVLRHKSQLRLDSAGYASIQEILENPRIRRHHATEAWLRYIIQENAKKRFTLDATGTHVRAAQGHSVYIDPSKLLRRLSLEDFGNRVPAKALHSTYQIYLPSIVQHGLRPGGKKGERFRKHVHLATSRDPTAGLRAGSEIILEVDLERAHNSGCTFFLSENGVLLTEDVIPPPCIIRATRTDSGKVIELRNFRPEYKRDCAAPCMLLPVGTCLDDVTSINASPAQRTLSLFGRLTSRPRTELSSTMGLLTHRNECFHFGWNWHTSHRQESCSRTTAVRANAAPSIPTACMWGAWPLHLGDCNLVKHASGVTHQKAILHSPQVIFGFKATMQRGTPQGSERSYTWQVNPPRSEVSSPPPEDRDASSVPSSSERNTAGVSQTSARHAAETQDKATARPRPTMASGLRAVATSRSAPCQGNISLGPERRADASYDIGGSQTGVPSTAPLHSAYYDEADADMASPEPSDVADGIQMGTGGSEDASPQSRPSVDRDPAGTPSSMAWPNPTEEDDIDFRFGAHEGHAELDRQHPTGVTLQRMRGRPKAVTKLLVRSGLRCHKCHLKTWVCLCDRAPVELNNRGEGPRKFDLHMSSHSLRQYAVATPNYLVAGTSHDAHSGRAKALHGRRWAAIPVISAESHYALLPAGRIPAAILAHRPLAEYLFKQHCLATLHPNPRLTNSLPIRGPKSALEPYHTLLSSLVAGKLQGVRVSPLSAGGGGLCRAQPEFPSRPGKQAEGIHKQLGFSPVSYFFVNPPNSPRRPDGSVPWGHKFRLWKFRYKVVKRRKKMSVRLRETRDQATHQKKGNQAKARQIAARKIAPRRPDARSGMRTIQGAPRSLRLLIVLLSCPPANCVRIEPGQPGNMHPLHIRVGKRAWLRAQKQANQQGYAWYRGRILCSNGAPCQTTGTMPPNLARRSKPVVNSRGATARLKVMTLNVGHMSAFLWGELKAHLGSGTCDYDVVCLQELHWTQTCQFSVGGWSAVVSAGQDKSDGVMVLVNPRFKQSQVKYDEILKGRLLRVQLAIEDSRVEVFCCYQYVWQTALTKDDNLRRRQNLLDKLCTHVRAIAKRSTVIVLGDFNAELVPSQGRVGQSLARTPRHVGPEAPSPYALTRAVEEMELVALNTWCTRFPHTSFTSTGNSQIDFIWVREASADKTARLCQPADPAIGSWRFMGHKQLDASIRLIKHFHLKKAGATATRVDKVTLSEHARIKHPSTDTLRERVRVALAQVPDTKPDAALANINKALLDASAAVYPSRPRARNNNQQDFLPIWQLRDVLRKHWRRDILGLFQAWKFSHKLARMAKDARSRHIAQRRERVSRILLATQEAADTHLPHKVYQLVSQLKPWSPRPRPRLKSKQGELLTAKGEHQRLVAYCKEVFAPALSVPEAGPPKLLMTAEDWTKYLGQTQIGKAVPQGSAPAAAWKICSDLLGPHLERISLAVEEDGTLPSTWCSPELIWLTKPNKAPDLPEHLRPIGLLTPTAKAAAAAVRETLMPGIQKMLQTVPQFAYLANRDIYDALARVNGQIASIKHSLAFTVSNRFVQRQRREANAGTGRWIKPISGGALLSVDLHKAFDLLTREQLQCTLSKIDADEGIKHTALLLHTQCQYLLFHDGQANAVDTKRGVRQGCRLAPALWSAVSGDLLTNMVPDPFKGPMTVFADDHLGAWTFHTQADILAMERDVLTMFRVLTDAGMCVNPSKSKLIITVKGAEAERHTKRRIVRIQGQPHWCFEEGDARIEVPVVAEFVYLGTIVTQGRQSDRTVSHRLEEARKREGQLRRCIRNRSVLRAGTRVAIWRACVVASAMYGLLAQELTATNVATLRQWYHKSLRAVTNTPAHITHVSNAELRAKFGLLDPLESLLQLTRNKLRRLSELQAGHAAKLASTMEHWNKCEQNLAILAHTDNLTLTPITADVSVSILWALL